MYYTSISELSAARNISLTEIGKIVGFTKTVAFRNFKRNSLNVHELMKLASYFNLIVEILPAEIPEKALLFHYSGKTLEPQTVVDSPHKAINSYCVSKKITPFRDFILKSSSISANQFDRRNNDNTKFRVSELILLFKALKIKAFVGSAFFLLVDESK